jgi:hypothetical protein
MAAAEVPLDLPDGLTPAQHNVLRAFKKADNPEYWGGSGMRCFAQGEEIMSAKQAVAAAVALECVTRREEARRPAPDGERQERKEPLVWEAAGCSEADSLTQLAKRLKQYWKKVETAGKDGPGESPDKTFAAAALDSIRHVLRYATCFALRGRARYSSIGDSPGPWLQMVGDYGEPRTQRGGAPKAGGGELASLMPRMISGDAGLPDFCTVAVCKCKTGLIPECSKLANHFSKAQGDLHLAGLNRGVCELRRCVDTLRAAGAEIPEHLRVKAARRDCLSASAQQGIPWSRAQVERLIAYKEHHGDSCEWAACAQHVGERTGTQCSDKWQQLTRIWDDNESQIKQIREDHATELWFLKNELRCKDEELDAERARVQALGKRRHPMVGGKQPAGKRPMVGGKQPAGKRPMVGGQQPVAARASDSSSDSSDSGSDSSDLSDSE